LTKNNCDLHTTDKFRKAFRNLPAPVQRKARKAFHLWRQDPGNPLLPYKQIHQIKTGLFHPYRARLGAVGIKAENHLIWFWVGSHSDYDKLVKQL
jgi:hypothetical protein